MKKLLLTIGTVALALAVNAQNAGISKMAIYDNFMDADTSTKAVADEFSLATDSIKWDPTLKAPVPSEKAYMGVFWGESVPTAADKYKAQKLRDGSGTLKYVISQDTGAYKPIYLSFGTYASGTVEKSFTIDLTNDANLSFSFKNSGTKVLRLQVQVQDIDDTTLAYSAGATQDLFYNYNLGFTQGESAPIGAGETVNFTYDLKDAIVGAQPGDLVLPNAQFNYSKVKAVMLTVIQDAVVVPGSDYRPVALVDYPVEISNFKLGDVTTIVNGIENFTTLAADEIVSAYDMMGNFAGKGKIKELNLEAGRTYIIKGASETKKIVMVK